MLYGTNLLSTLPGEWVVTNGIATSSAITLLTNGIATQQIDITELAVMPTELLLSVVSSRYTDSYAPDLFARLHVETVAGEVFDYIMPIINTAANLCTIELPTIETEYILLTFSLQALVSATITEWGLFAPLTQSVDLTEIESMIPRLLKDYNTSALSVALPEDTIALISSYITEATEMSGHLSLSYIAATASTLIIRIKDNEVEELYSPAYFNLAAGQGTIGLPHAYLSKKAGYHNFTVTAQVISGSLQIDTRKVLYIIDGAHFAYSTLDVGAVVSDLTVRRTSGEDTISYIYAACLDDGILLIKKCDYSNILANAWISCASLGAAVSAAIEFWGTWNILVSPYVFNTDTEPWIGWVNDLGVLQVKQLENEDSLFTLSTDVLYVCSTMGWNNTYTPGNDQGMLFTYIKTDGLVYYRGYCLQEDLTYIWETERAITEYTGTAISVNAFRTNDFRLGIDILDTSGTTHTYITTRNWPGMSIPAENLVLSTEATVEVTEINYIDAFEPDEYLTAGIEAVITPLWALSPVIASAENYANEEGDYGYNIRLRFDELVFATTGNEYQFTITDSLNTVVHCVSIINSGRELLLTFSNLNNVTNPVVLAYAPGTIMGEVVALEADSISINLTGLVPTYVPPPVVLSIENTIDWMEIT